MERSSFSYPVPLTSDVSSLHWDATLVEINDLQCRLKLIFCFESRSDVRVLTSFRGVRRETVSLYTASLFKDVPEGIKSLGTSF